jgi:hypothetical protein
MNGLCLLKEALVMKVSKRAKALWERFQEWYRPLSPKKKVFFWMGTVLLLIVFVGLITPNPQPTESNQTPQGNQPAQEQPAQQPQPAQQQQPAQAQQGEVPTLPGLTAADVTINMENKGFECGGMQIGEKYTTWACESTLAPLGDAQRHTVTDVVLQVTGDGPSEIYSVDTTVLVYDRAGNDELAGELLGYVATIPYEGSQPELARAWVENNVSQVDKGVVKRQTFGGVDYELYGPRTVRILEIDAPGWETAGS